MSIRNECYCGISELVVYKIMTHMMVCTNIIRAKAIRQICIPFQIYARRFTIILADIWFLFVRADSLKQFADWLQNDSILGVFKLPFVC